MVQAVLNNACSSLSYHPTSWQSNEVRDGILIQDYIPAKQIWTAQLDEDPPCKINILNGCYPFTKSYVTVNNNIRFFLFQDWIFRFIGELRVKMHCGKTDFIIWLEDQSKFLLFLQFLSFTGGIPFHHCYVFIHHQSQTDQTTQKVHFCAFSEKHWNSNSFKVY